MTARASRFHVLLISRVPEEHREVLRSFRRAGAHVFFASSPLRAVSLLRLQPELVLVDLAHGATLNPALVQALNQRDRAMLVVALHNGSLESVDEHATELSVHGFCRPDDLAGGALMTAGAAFPASMSIH